MTIQVQNILDRVSGTLGNEEFLTLLETQAVRIERIVSHAASSPEGFWYDQPQIEWVMVLRGHAVLEFDDGQRIAMKEGDYLTIPPHARHRVDSTAPGTIWLAVHLNE
jgi:cupin 2 domain-containing protein